ncbi:DNA recombination protein RmuC [Agromyces intestinalis]|uniref:DNA recombination protein RmuC n=1 Tax=Agromyces intestinalis TaxID=2592652 RepID=A0A5C1YJZ0_9MICO|nr:DNA recombination protein RmuC [Agromyces intestinalis]QEO15489.1 DNA recombination protein RmuC [Agromyces intestinalis]
MEILLLIIGLVVGGALGALTAWFVGARRADAGAGAPGEDPALVAARHERELLEVRAEAQAALARARADEQRVQGELRAELSAVEATAVGLREQVLAAQQQYRELVERQRADQAAREQRELAESKVLQALAPVKQTISDMQAKVTQLEQQRHLQHGELSQQLKIAAENEERLRSTAETLASALRSNSTRGVWGETQLRSVVEAAGLIERVDFDTQRSITTDSGAGRPDMVIHLPGGKHIAVDAKVPFNAYLEASQIPPTATGTEGAQRESLMKGHVRAVRDHITALGSKTYWEGLGASPEMVIAFIPSESLISSALEADPALLEFAFSKRVALASPVTLWSVLKTVAFSWQQDVLTNEAKTLFDLSRELYSRLSTTAGQLEKLGRTIERTVKDYNAFVGSLESRVLPTARKLSALDETKVFATLEGIDESPRELTAYEFTTAIAAESTDRAELESVVDAEIDAADVAEPADDEVSLDSDPALELDVLPGTEHLVADIDPDIRRSADA